MQTWIIPISHPSARSLKMILVGVLEQSSINPGLGLFLEEKEGNLYSHEGIAKESRLAKKTNRTGPVDIIRSPGYKCASNKQNPGLVSVVTEYI